MHPRCGAHSSAHRLSQNILQEIDQWLTPREVMFDVVFHACSHVNDAFVFKDQATGKELVRRWLGESWSFAHKFTIALPARDLELQVGILYNENFEPVVTQENPIELSRVAVTQHKTIAIYIGGWSSSIKIFDKLGELILER